MNRRPALDIVIESPLWNSVPGVKPALRRAIKAALPEGQPKIAEAELAIVLTDDAAIRKLNRQWRGRDQPTNVLSFPSPSARRPDIGGRLLGDVVIAFETAAREADTQGLPLAHHLAHLAVHGYLHLLGYDHETESEAETMERLEREILARLDVPDPYATREEA
jgi:probable rRNA maturation factor